MWQKNAKECKKGKECKFLESYAWPPHLQGPLASQGEPRAASPLRARRQGRQGSPLPQKKRLRRTPKAIQRHLIEPLRKLFMVLEALIYSVSKLPLLTVTLCFLKIL